MAGKVDFTFRQGTTFRRRIVWQDESGAGIPLAGYAIRFQARRDQEEPVIDLSLGAGITLGATPGEFWLTVSAAATDTIPAASYPFDLLMTAPDGTVTDLLAGNVNVSHRLIQ